MRRLCYSLAPTLPRSFVFMLPVLMHLQSPFIFICQLSIEREKASIAHRTTEMGSKGKQLQGRGEQSEGCLYGDVLDAVISRVSPLDLLPASRVSKAWRAAVLSSPRRRCPPWFVLHCQSRRRTTAASTYAFDPLSRSWHSVPGAPTCPLPPGTDGRPPQVAGYARSEIGGTRLYALSASSLALAADPFGTEWREVDAPPYWRTSPVVAVVGPLIVVAGGTSELEDDESSVEVCDGGGWETCEPMPECFRWSASLSAAATEKRLYVIERQAPFAASWFNPEAKRWGPARRVQIPDPAVRHVAMGHAGGRLLLAGAGGREQLASVRVWAVEEETMVVGEEVGRMPAEMVAGMVEGDSSQGWGLWSLGFLCEGEFAYVFNPSYLNEFFLCELGVGGWGRWERIARPEGVEARPMHDVLFSCSAVAVDDAYVAEKIRDRRSPDY